MKLLTLLITIFTLNANNQTPPKLHFNHIYFVLDSADLAAIQHSDFIKNKLTAFSIRTTTADSGDTWTGSYMYGIDNYLELFDSSGAGESLGIAGIGFSVDRLGEINKLDSILKKKYQTNIGIRERKFGDKMVPWFTNLYIDDSSFFNSTNIYFWVMEYRPEYFEYNHWAYSNNNFTRRTYLKEYDAERKNKLLRRFTGITLKTTKQEQEYLTNFLSLCDYKKTDANTLISPDNFSFHFAERNQDDRYSIESIEFETSGSVNYTIPISQNIQIVIDSTKGKILFK
ncbi:MAG: DUF5829 family protein [Parafilimonas sp.]